MAGVFIDQNSAMWGLAIFCQLWGMKFKTGKK
jgi:hypothetical protein